METKLALARVLNCSVTDFTGEVEILSGMDRDNETFVSLGQQAISKLDDLIDFMQLGSISTTGFTDKKYLNTKRYIIIDKTAYSSRSIDIFTAFIKFITSLEKENEL